MIEPFCTIYICAIGRLRYLCVLPSLGACATKLRIRKRTGCPLTKSTEHTGKNGGQMLASSIEWILIVSGIGTAAGGLAACLFPKQVLQLVFGAQSNDGLTMFFVRHWGALLCVVCALTVYSAYVPATRVPILTAAVVEKFVIVALIFFGPVKRTLAMTAVGTLDAVLAVLFIAYLAGV